MQIEEIKKLADLSKIEMSLEEMQSIAHDFEAILAYVGQVQEVSNLDKNVLKKEEGSDLSPKIKNIMREDTVDKNSGQLADKIIEQFPDSEDRFLKVKQIL